MEHEEFRKELVRQINLNAKYFKPAEVVTLLDFVATIKEGE